MGMERDGVRGAGVAQRSRRTWRSLWLAAALATALGLALAACGQTTAPVPTFTGGVYANTQYHFKITYPDGWKVNAQPSASTVLPLTVTITRSSAVNTPGDPISTLTIAVFNAHNTNIAKSIKALPADKTLQKTTLAGLSAYASAPVQQQVPSSTITDTHTDYYLVTADWEYQLSTDAISGEDTISALQSMLASFTLAA